MWRKLIALLFGIGATSCDQAKQGQHDGGGDGVTIVLSDEPGWTEAEKEAVSRAGMALLMDSMQATGSKGELPAQMVVTRAMAAAAAAKNLSEATKHAERFRKQVIVLDEEEETRAVEQLERWLENRPEPASESLRKEALKRTLLDIGPSSLATFNAIREKHDIDSLGTFFSSFDEPAEVSPWLPVEFFELASRDGEQIGLVAHDPDSGYTEWSVATNDYTDSDLRFGQRGATFVEYLKLQIEDRLELIMDDAGHEPEYADEIAGCSTGNKVTAGSSHHVPAASSRRSLVFGGK